MLSRLRIRTKLLLAPGVVLALLVLVSCGAYVAMLRQNDSLESIVQQRAAHIRAAVELAGSAQRAHAQAYQVLTWISGSFPKTRVDPLVRDLQLQQAGVERGFGALADLLRDSPDGRRNVELARAAWAAYVPAVQDVIEIARVDQSISASAMSKAERAFAVVAQRLADLAQHEQALSEQASNAAASDFRTASTLIPLVVALSAVAALAITMAVRRALLGGIAAIEAAARGLASGDLTVRPRVDGEDEIAATSRALDAGIRSLNGNLRSVLDSARAIGAASREIGLGKASLPPRAGMRAAVEQGTQAMQALAAALDGHVDSAQAARQLAQAAESAAQEGSMLTHRLVASMDEVRRAIARLEQVGTLHEARALARDAQAASQGGSAWAAQAGACMAGLADAARGMDDLALDIASASSAHADDLAGASQAILRVDTLTQQGTRMVEEAALAARALQQQALDLTRAVAAFRLDEALLDDPEDEAQQRRPAHPYLRLASSRGSGVFTRSR